jgi:hypothetical protein
MANSIVSPPAPETDAPSIRWHCESVFARAASASSIGEEVGPDVGQGRKLAAVFDERRRFDLGRDDLRV